MISFQFILFHFVTGIDFKDKLYFAGFGKIPRQKRREKRKREMKNMEGETGFVKVGCSSGLLKGFGVFYVLTSLRTFFMTCGCCYCCLQFFIGWTISGPFFVFKRCLQSTKRSRLAHSIKPSKTGTCKIQQRRREIIPITTINLNLPSLLLTPSS